MKRPRITVRWIIPLTVVGLIVIVALIYPLVGSRPVVPNGSATTSSTSTGPTIAGRSGMDMSLDPYVRLASPGLQTNYTLVLYGGPDAFGTYSLATARAPSGFNITINPASIIVGGALAVDVRVAISPVVSPGPYEITVSAKGERASYNQTFIFTVVKYLVQIHVGGFVPRTLQVTRGSTVTWVNFDTPNDDDNATHNITFSNAAIPAPLLTEYQSWSHTFEEIGTFNYSDTTHEPFPGTVVVSDS